MNRPFRLFMPAITLVFCATSACKKFSNNSKISPTGLVRQAQVFVDSLSTHGSPTNYRAAQPKAICWDLAQTLTINHSPALLAPIIFGNAILAKANFAGSQPFHLNYLTQFLYYKDSSGNPAALVLTSFPDSNYFKDPTRPFTGIQFVEDWYGNLIERLLYTRDGKILQYLPSHTRAASVDIIQTCYSIDGYNYSPSTGETIAWSEPAGCTVEYIESGSTGGAVGSIVPPGGGLAAGGKAGSTAMVNILPGNSIIKSIAAYFQCFTNVGGTDHHYSVTVCVDQPDPGTRTPWTISQGGSSGSSAGNNPVDAGHAFLILTETYGNTTISRNVGFYPSGNVNPISLTSQGTLNDDETHIYDISGTFTVNNSQFFNILNYIAQGSTQGYLYNLNSNNCTTFVIDAAQQAGISLPHTIGTWPEGAGNDPGDLGEDLRTNSIPGMTLNTAGGSGNSHYNNGQCN